MNMLETLPEPGVEISDRELASAVPVAVRNKIQQVLIERSGEDAATWIQENSFRFRQMLKRDADLRKLAVENIDEAISAIEERLRESGDN